MFRQPASKNWFERYAYSWNPLSIILLPISWLFRTIVVLRRYAYRQGLLRVHRFPVPVVVVGNIAVGGTGKTPLVLWVVEQLRGAGYRPAIVTRGYGGAAKTWPQWVNADSDPEQVGDEPVVLARHAGCPVVAAPNRVQAVREVLSRGGYNVIVSDDGLQHYALGRDVEIVVIDGERGFGNGQCLPAGPLREPRGRLREADIVVTHGAGGGEGSAMTLVGSTLRKLTGDSDICELESLRGKSVHAVAGIGYPDRFFTALRRGGLEVQEHVFPDHHRFTAEDLPPAGAVPVIMTEKDAVKCRVFARDNDWYLPVVAAVDAAVGRKLLQLLGNRGFVAPERASND